MRRLIYLILRLPNSDTGSGGSRGARSVFRPVDAAEKRRWGTRHWKHPEPGIEQNPTSTDADPDVPVPDATAADATTTLGGPGLTKRALGRLKHKRALDQLRQETSMTEDVSESGSDSTKIRADSDEEKG